MNQSKIRHPHVVRETITEIEEFLKLLTGWPDSKKQRHARRHDPGRNEPTRVTEHSHYISHKSDTGLTTQRPTLHDRVAHETAGDITYATFLHAHEAQKSLSQSQLFPLTENDLPHKPDNFNTTHFIAFKPGLSIDLHKAQSRGVVRESLAYIQGGLLDGAVEPRLQPYVPVMYVTVWDGVKQVGRKVVDGGMWKEMGERVFKWARQENLL